MADKYAAQLYRTRTNVCRFLMFVGTPHNNKYSSRSSVALFDIRLLYISSGLEINARRALPNVLTKRVNQRLMMQLERGRTTSGQQNVMRRVVEGIWPKLTKFTNH